MTTKLPDPRINAYRSDLAYTGLQGIVDAPKYVAGEERVTITSVGPLRREPRADAALDTELLFGERVMLLDEQDGWAWVQSTRDNYVGYVASECLGHPAGAATHRVAMPSTFIFPEPDIKRPPAETIPLNAQFVASASSGSFVELEGGGYVFAKHVVSLNDHDVDFVETARLFTGTPYLWGGRSYGGIDCSGLVQMALMAAGQKCPRDSDMQEAMLGDAVNTDAEISELKRGDLIFWQGHVGIMSDSQNLLHATAYYMQTVIEPFSEARARIAASDTGDVCTVRRM